MSTPSTFAMRMAAAHPAAVRKLMPGQSSQVTHLSDMQITRVSLVDRGANRRVFAVLKRATPISKVATFAQLRATTALRDWLPGALTMLGQIVDAALEPGLEGVTTEERLAAVKNSADEFKAALVEQVAAAISAQASSSTIAARAPSVRKGRSRWAGIL